MTSAVAQIIDDLEKLPEAEQNDLAKWLKLEIARRARCGTTADSHLAREMESGDYGIPVAVSPGLLSANGSSAAQPVVTISGIELLWLELLREEGEGE